MSEKGKAGDVVRIRVELLDIAPAIWREIEVPSTYTFWDLHVAIQDAMGWLDYHLHAFRLKEPVTGEIVEIGIPFDDDFDNGPPTLPGWRVPVLSYLDRPGQSMDYDYDFGDGWRHRIDLLDIVPRKTGEKYPLCVAGQRACPPEDCGGTWGYQTLLEALADPTHEEHHDMLRWLGGPFDSEHFDAAEVQFDDPQERWRRAFEQGDPGPGH
jgi:hypothetical protein